MLNVQNVSLQRGKRLALDKVSVTLKKEEILGLKGPSGSGKSSLLRCIQGLEPYQGKITLEGRACLIFQDFQLFPHMKVIENIAYVLKKVRLLPKDEADKQALELLSKLGLEDKAQEWPSTLSGGQKQRVAILRAIASNADLLLLDEPTSALDKDSIASLRSLFQSLNEMGLTLLIVSHDETFLETVCHRILHLKEGVLLENDSLPAE